MERKKGGGGDREKLGMKGNDVCRRRYVCVCVCYAFFQTKMKVYFLTKLALTPWGRWNRTERVFEILYFLAYFEFKI